MVKEYSRCQNVLNLLCRGPHRRCAVGDHADNVRLLTDVIQHLLRNVGAILARRACHRNRQIQHASGGSTQEEVDVRNAFVCCPVRQDSPRSSSSQ
eukprot:8402978-Lingulodinium_polyedra.AAC.1